jgi:flagellar motor switch protein FliG
LLLERVSSDKLIVALRGSDPHLRDLILAAVPARSRRIIEQELANGPAPAQKEIQKARRAIADMALEMSERGEIELKPNSDN